MIQSVYIASPYTGNEDQNVRIQIDTAAELRYRGFFPFWPLHSHFEHMAHPKPYDIWMNADLYWLAKCDCVLRLPGESSGADKEIEHAKRLNIPVYYSLDELLKKFNIHKKA